MVFTSFVDTQTDGRTPALYQVGRIKITDTTEYCVRLEPGTFAMRSESHTTRQQARMQSKGFEYSHD